MRIAFLGNGDFGVPALRALARSGHEVVSVVTRPDRSAGRGRRPAPTPVKAEALQLDIPVLEIADLKASDTADSLAALEAELWVVVAFPIIPAALLEIPPRGTVNLHASLLPLYRGAAPVQWALIRGEEVTGLTTFFIDAGVDTGGICLQREVAIEPGENAGELSGRLSTIGADLMLETVDRIEEGTAPRVPQEPALATPAPKLAKGDGELDWEVPARDLVNMIRGLNPWPGSFTFLHGERILVLRAAVVPESEIPWGSGEIPAPGVIGGFLEEGTPVVAAGDGKGVALTELQREGRRPAPGAEVARGMRCEEGDRFGAAG